MLSLQASLRARMAKMAKRPSIVSIASTSVAAGTPGLVLMVNGNDFQRNSTIDWNGAARVTTFVSSHQLKATILSSDLATPATVKVTVVSPPRRNRLRRDNELRFLGRSAKVGLGSQGCRAW